MAKVYDLEGNEHDKEPVDVRECVEILGWSATKPEPKTEEELPPPVMTTEEMVDAIKAAGIEIPKNSKADKIKEIFDSLKTE